MTDPLNTTATFSADEYAVLIAGGHAIAEIGALLRDRPEHQRTAARDLQGIEALQEVNNRVTHLLDLWSEALELEHDHWAEMDGPGARHGVEPAENDE